MGRAVDRSIVAGLVLAFSAAVIGAGWQLSTRHAVITVLAPPDLALLRYAVPALLLLPWLPPGGIWPDRVSRWRLLLIVTGAGLPFGLLAMSGAQLAPSSHMGVLVAGVAPLAAAAAAACLTRTWPLRSALVGLALMATGVALLGADAWVTMAHDTLAGDALFVTAALLWAAFTLALRGVTLSTWQVVAVVNAWSLLLLAPWCAARLLVGSSTLLHLTPADLWWHGLLQGGVAGVLGIVTYVAAVARLGAARAAASGALVPALSAGGGAWWFGDRLGAFEIAAVAATVIGVALASGALSLSTGRPRAVD